MYILNIFFTDNQLASAFSL